MCQMGFRDVPGGVQDVSDGVQDVPGGGQRCIRWGSVICQMGFRDANIKLTSKTGCKDICVC